MPRSTGGSISCGCSTVADGSVIKFPACSSRVRRESEHHASCRGDYQGRCLFLLVLHLRIMRERLNSNSSEASSLPRTQWPAQSACDVSAPNASSHSEISALQSMGWGDLGSLRV